MARTSRRTAELRKATPTEALPLADAVEAVKKSATAKFDETVEVALRLGVDPRKSDQMVRGVTALPAGTGKSVRVAVICEYDNAAAATEAGADLVGFEDLIDNIGKGQLDFDILIAEPMVMSRLAKHGKILGPKGLMPNPKSGTVTKDLAGAVKRVKAGQSTYRTERGGVVHAPIGLASFSQEDLVANFTALLESVRKAKPSSAKGQYLVKASLSSTMGPAIPIDLAPLR